MPKHIIIRYMFALCMQAAKGDNEAFGKLSARAMEMRRLIRITGFSAPRASQVTLFESIFYIYIYIYDMKQDRYMRLISF